MAFRQLIGSAWQKLQSHESRYEHVLCFKFINIDI